MKKYFLFFSCFFVIFAFAAYSQPNQEPNIADSTTKTPNVKNLNESKPTIEKFVAAPAILQLGQEIVLTWETENAISVGILPGIGRVEKNGEITLAPTKSITYKISAIGWDTIVHRSLEISVMEPPDMLAPPPPMLRKQGDKKIFNIAFQTNKSGIPSSAEADLNDLFSVLEKKSNMIIQISGHTDNKGNEKFNTKLSLERAEAVKSYLVEKGIDEWRISTLGSGSSEPLAPNTTLEGRLKNRRIEIIVLKD